METVVVVVRSKFCFSRTLRNQTLQWRWSSKKKTKYGAKVTTRILARPIIELYYPIVSVMARLVITNCKLWKLSSSIIHFCTKWKQKNILKCLQLIHFNRPLLSPFFEAKLKFLGYITYLLKYILPQGLLYFTKV